MFPNNVFCTNIYLLFYLTMFLILKYRIRFTPPCFHNLLGFEAIYQDMKLCKDMDQHVARTIMYFVPYLDHNHDMHIPDLFLGAFLGHQD